MRTTIEIRNNAYQQACDTGLINDIAKDVLKIIKDHGPVTSMMVQDIYSKTIKRRGTRSICARVTELNGLGAIVQYSEDKCEITGHKAAYWNIAPDCSNLFRPVKVKTKAQLRSSVRKAIKKLDLAALCPENQAHHYRLLVRQAREVLEGVLE